MKRLLSLSIPFILAGCGVTTPGVTAPGVSDAKLHDLCVATGAMSTDQDVQALLSTIQADRQKGTSYADEISAMLNGHCKALLNSNSCTNCLMAALKQAYGY